MKLVLMTTLLLSMTNVNAAKTSSFSKVLKKVIDAKSVRGLKDKTIKSRLAKLNESTIKVFDSEDFPGADATVMNRTYRNAKDNQAIVSKIDVSDYGSLRVQTETYQWGNHVASRINTEFEPSQFIVRSTKNKNILISADNGKMTLEASIRFVEDGMTMKITHLKGNPAFQGVVGKFPGSQELRLRNFKLGWNDNISYSNTRGFVNSHNGMKITDQKIINDYIRSIFTK